MTRILRHRPSPAMAVAFLALCVALAGTASALPGHNRVKKDDIAPSAVRSSDIAGNAIRTRHIKARNVTRSKIAKRSVDSSLVGVDALLGSNILESSLSKVPDSDKLDGKDSSEFLSGIKVARFALTDGQTKDVLKSGPFTLTARCTISVAGDTAEILISTTQDHAAFDAADSDADLTSSDPEAGRQFVVATGPNGTPQFSRVADGVALAPDGTEIDGATLFAGVNVLGFTSQCVFGGRSAG
jgi:hypothetical protein